MDFILLFLQSGYFGMQDVTDDVDMKSFLPKMYNGKQNIAQIVEVSH